MSRQFGAGKIFLTNGTRKTEYKQENEVELFPQGSNSVSCIAGEFFTSWTTREALFSHIIHKVNSKWTIFLNVKTKL